MESTLLLNASFEPLKVVPWQRAMTLFCQGKAEILETHDREVRAVTFSFRLPSVVRLLRFVKVRRRSQVPFTRANIYARDNYTCAYCEQQKPIDELTFDHVVPVAQGGTRGWENITTACVDCNRRKGARTPQEAGLTLRRQPRRPIVLPTLRVSVGLYKQPESWRNWLYWSVELDTN